MAMDNKNKDQKVLDFMFDPFLVEYNLNGDPEQSLMTSVEECSDKDSLTKEQIDSKQLELKAVELANQSKFDEALKYFEQSLNIWPENASVYNNRAQTYRLLNRIEDALRDLDKSIQLSDGGNGDNGGQNFKTNATVAKQAYCQRALIYLLRENKEQGLRDMKRSADLGNRFARSYMAKLNPYAALCNQMLQEMFEQYKCKPTNSGERKVDHNNN